ncbi:sugar phosphate isomerase/epimerase family protein [Foetidibacter luteolus]|uniref:sugar phosphate isomerase/epimerase family protein n=1 Tax=Foetidibacter luteolus TaxID=2608880 RepID=UPI00129B3F46|nr:sugar phosphate isomerase/epimerase [Foetidibacter luteolus]
MYKRRKFLQNSGALVLGGLALSQNAKAFFLPQAAHPVGLQLYTLFNIIDNDVQGNLKKVADIGFKEVESAFSKKGGYYGMKPKEFADYVAGLGMSWKSHHVLGAPFKLPANAKPPTGPDGKPIEIPPMRNLKENMQQLVDEAAEGGVPYLVCAMSPTGTTEEIKSTVDVLNKTGEACKKAGISFAYHNHDMEFKEVDGKKPYDIMLADTGADTVKMELDLCWVTKAGVDPVELFNKNPGRFPLWHVKDIDKAMTGPQPVGTGIIDFKRIFANAATAGMQHFFIEHDMPADPFASITTSYGNIQKILQA